MGLNMNYSLFTEGSHSSYNIPEYKKYYKPSVLVEDTIFQAIAEFNQEIRESRYLLSTLYEIESTNESTASVNIINGANAIIGKAKIAIVNLCKRIMEIIGKIIDTISSKATKVKDSIEIKYRTHERISILKKALDNTSDKDKSIRISSIVPTRDLVDVSFPDTSIIGSDLVKMATDTMNNYCTNIVQKDGMNSSFLGDSEVKASDSFVNFIESHKDAMLRAVFGKYDYDPTNITKSAIEASDKAFGNSNNSDTTLTLDLYMLACDNLEDSSSIISKMKDIQSKAKKDFDKITAEMDVISKSVTYLDKMVNKSYNFKMKEEYYKSTRIIIERINRSLNVIQQVINASYNILTHKMIRINDIYGATGDSMRVKKACHALMNKYLKIEDDTVSESYDETYSAIDAIDEVFDIQNDFNAFTIMAEDAFMEREFSKSIIEAIMEAEGDNNSSNTNTQTTEPSTTETKQNIVQKAGSSVLQWLKEMIGKVGSTLERFKARIEEIVVKNVDGKTFWDKNKDAISKLSLTDTKVNQWFKFNIDAFSKSTYVKFDINSNDLKSDDDIQNAILRKITSNPPAAKEGETFKDRINHAYQGEYVDDKNGEGQPLSNVGYDHTAAYTFIDDFITKGFGGDTLGNVTEDYKNLDTDFKNVNKNYDQLVEQRKSSGSSSISTQNTENADNKKAEPQNASAMIEDDFKFNLAEHFGLITHEASFTVGQNDSQSASALSGGDAKSSQDKELDDMIRRCFKCNTIAITAKMTCALSAYKQYMGLFKAVYGNGKKETKTNSENEKSENK